MKSKRFYPNLVRIHKGISTFLKKSGIFGIHSWGVYFLLVCSGDLFSQVPLQASIPPISLKVIPLSLAPSEYYFHAVLDRRTDRSPVAFLVPISNPQGTNLELVDLKGGLLPAIQTFVNGSLTRNMSLRPIVITITDCKIVEKLIDNQRGVIAGEVFLDFGFHLKRGDDLVHLLDFKGGMSYKRSLRQISVIEPVFRRSLGNALRYFHEWIEKEAGQNEKLAHSVTVNLVDHRINADDDTVFYDPQRPLNWEDFKGRPRFGNFAASIFASIAYEGDSRLVDGEVQIDLRFKTYMLKRSSWVRGTNNAYGLNHEQRHFDIAQIITERLKAKLDTMTLLPHNFDRVVSFEFLEAYREMNALQEAYDRETAHGMNANAQARWDARIDEELKSYGVTR